MAAISKPILGNFSVELGELIALHEGLLLAKNLNLVINLTKVDASNVAVMLNSNSSYLRDAMFIISDIQALRSDVGAFSCQAIPRESNSLAHGLANLAFSSGKEMQWRNADPSCIPSGL